METCSVCGSDDGPTLRQCNMCLSKFHHMCIVEEAAKNGWPEAEEGQELWAVHKVSSSAQDVPPPAKKRGRPKGAKNKAKVPDVQGEGAKENVWLAYELSQLPYAFSKFGASYVDGTSPWTAQYGRAKDDELLVVMMALSDVASIDDLPANVCRRRLEDTTDDATCLD
ncbi:hypothetical protein DYB36_008503 [Aphanomyces astaci]|uniref:Uncharacterized protein n=3 Tax=Aphanomyces astaci TaxID=112090 RepID=A0A397AM70_APHAT|nr:hypothetical protein DYB36_008503 [Aphanomyces astaci]